MSRSRDVAVIAGGSAGRFDRLDLATRVMDDDAVEIVMFERMSEGSGAAAALERTSNDAAGYDSELPEIVRQFAPLLKRGGKIIGNFGLANVDLAGTVVVDTLRELGLENVRVGVVRGDDVLEQVLEADLPLPELGGTVSDLGDHLISAHAYLGCEGVIDVLEQGASVVVGGRLADHSLAVGPLAHRLSWALDDWDSLAVGALAGQLLQGGCGVTGGGFADPPLRIVPDLDQIGFPIIRVEGDTLTVSKPPNTGGIVSADCIKTRLFHEVFDPGRVITPDVELDLSNLVVDQVAAETVTITGALGRRRPEQLRVLVGYRAGWRTDSELAFGGPRCVDRARAAEEVLRKRLRRRSSEIDALDISLIGVNALFGDALPLSATPSEVVLRVAARAATKEIAEWINWEAVWQYWSTVGVGLKSFQVSPAYGVTYAYIPRGDTPSSTVCL